MVNKWYGLFSHTGRELEALASKDLEWDIRLNAVITNNMDYFGSLDMQGVAVYRMASFKDVNWLLNQPQYVEDNSLITLNGYMGIVPSDVLRNLKMRGCKLYNIHPAPIQIYPELRGKDPQERMYEGIQKGKYNCIGVVIHEVDEGVDTGKIVHWVLRMVDRCITKYELYERLHKLGIQAWESFFRERMYENGENN